MARAIRSAQLESRTARLKLPITSKPVWVKIGEGLSLGYRRNKTDGTWSVRKSDGRGGNWIKRLADADDFAEANNAGILTYWQASERAREIGLVGTDKGDAGKLVTVDEAVHRYKLNLEKRGGDPGNADRIHAHLPAALAAKTVALLTVRDFQPWSDGMAEEELAPASINRINAALQAALNLAAAEDERIANARVWMKALATIFDASEARNIAVPDDVIRGIVASAYEVHIEFGLFAETAAVTGARPSQLGRLNVDDLQAKGREPRLLMPSSRKGRGRKRIERRPVAITPSLAKKLLAASKDQPAHAPLLRKPSGERWSKSDHSRLFERAVAIFLKTQPRKSRPDWADATIYAFRHSSIIRALLSHVPMRVVASAHDTGVAMLERNYAKYISDHADAVSRRALLDVDASVGDNIVAIRQSQSGGSVL
jgi:integrase